MFRDLPPSHFLFKIGSFSSLVKTEVEKYKSNSFQTGGHLWRLVLYPNGNKKSNGNGYISLYLELDRNSNLSLNWEVNVDFKLFVYDQIRDKYLAIKDWVVPVRRFDEMQTEWGFSQLLSLETFNNASNGYLVHDCCTFGAEVFVIERPAKWEQLYPTGRTLTWKIENFSELTHQEYEYSPLHFVDDLKWKLLVYPKGTSSSKGTALSVYLALAEPNTLAPNRKLFVERKLRVRNQIKSKHSEKTINHWFSPSSSCTGYPNIVLLKYLHDPSMGYIVNDILIVEAEFLAISKVSASPTNTDTCY
ncbi:hypothetical protein PTKIN_Ptkin06aG0138100 [Pterospermum kingtungense]